LFGIQALSDDSLRILSTAGGLAERMADPALPAMVCALCPHVFERDERPIEIVIASLWASVKHPRLASPICRECASIPWESKRERIIARFREMLGPSMWSSDKAGAA
jgi:hypothetical protein